MNHYFENGAWHNRVPAVSKRSHTSKPWFAHNIIMPLRAGGSYLYPLGRDPEVAAANARLIDAAPELLDALQSMLTAFSLDNIGIDSSMERLKAKQAARAAIAKATRA